MFCLGDVCKVLDLTVKGVTQRLDKGVISTYPLKTAGGTQEAYFVTEDGLYDVILDRPEAGGESVSQVGDVGSAAHHP